MGETGIALAILGLLAAGGIAYVASKPAAATPAAPGSSSSSCGGALPAGYTWQPSQSLVHGEHVRVSMTAADFANVAGSMGLATGLAGWTSLLAEPQIASVFGATNICAWAPGDALPLDWPGDDVDDATEYHAEFVYQGQVALPTSGMPLPVKVWKATPPAPGVKATGGGVTGNPKPTAPSTNPQTVHLAAPGGDVVVTDTQPGTPLTVTIDGGGTFQVINAYDNVRNMTGVVTGTQAVPGYPTGPTQTGTFEFDTHAPSGGLILQWTDSSGNTYYSTVKYS